MLVCGRIGPPIPEHGNFGFMRIGVEGVRNVPSSGGSVAEERTGLVDRVRSECRRDAEAKGERRKKGAAEDEEGCHDRQ